MAATFALAAIGIASGCVDSTIRLEGNLDANQTTSSDNGALHFDALGHASITSGTTTLTLPVPHARETKRFGVTAVDLSTIPAEWRPFGADRGVTISALRMSSPLAIAGLRPGNVVTKIDGAGVATPSDFVARLAQKKEGDAVTLTLATYYGEADRDLEARAGAELDDESLVWIPELLNVQAGPTGAALNVGPLEGAIFGWRDAIGCFQHTLAMGSHPTWGMRSSYYRRFEWSGPLNFVSWRSDTELFGDREGRRKGTLYIFWFIPLTFEHPSGA